MQYSGGLSTTSPKVPSRVPFSLNIHATQPPFGDAMFIMPRTDEVSTIERMLSDPQTSSLLLIGTPGSGKSTLAGLLFRHFQAAQQSGLAAPRYLVWLGVEAYTSFSDIAMAIMGRVGAVEPGLELLKPEQQLAMLLHALRSLEGGALIVLDQFESLLYPEINQSATNQQILPLFLELLQTDLGPSRFLLTSYESPYEQQQKAGIELRVRSYLVSRISLPEGVTLLQQWGIQGSPEELTLVWQRCGGHVFALVLFSALVHLSGVSLSYFLNSPDYQPMWTDDVVLHLVTAVYHFLSPLQYTLMRTLSLFYEPVSFEGIMMTIAGDNAASGTDIGLFERELNLLTRLSLVQPVMSDTAVPCYTLHSLLRRYVLEYYIESPEPRAGNQATGVSQYGSVPHSAAELQAVLAIGHRQAARYYQYASHKRYPSRAQRRGLQDVEAIIAGVRHLCLARNWQSACELLFQEGLHENMVHWGAWPTLIELYTLLLSSPGTLRRQDEALVASQVALLYGRLSDYQQSQAYFEHALNIYRQIEDYAGQAGILLNQGELLREWGERELARQSFKQAVALNERAGDADLKCAILHNQGLLYHEERKYKEAFNHYAEALKLVQEGPRGQWNKGMILTNLGMLFYEQGVQKEALSILLAALQIRHAQQDPNAPLLERFLHTLERNMGPQAYAQACQEALAIQQQVLARILS